MAEILITPHILRDGTKFDLEGIDETGKAIEGTKRTSYTIHDGKSSRMGLGKSFFVNGKRILSKIQLTPNRKGNNNVVVEVKALFAPSSTPEEMDVLLLTWGKRGLWTKDFFKINSFIEQYKQRTGHFPKSLEELGQPLPKDVYSPSGEYYHYECNQKRFILSSCGEDGVYGNDDDKIRIAYPNRILSGQRDGLYPLEEDEDFRPQKETIGPSDRRPKGNCSLGGKVVSAQTGEPVSSAKVYLFYVGTFDALFIDVASDGTFEFKDIPTGPFSLRTTHTAGYQDAVYNPESKPGKFPQFSLAESEQRSDVILEVDTVKGSQLLTTPKVIVFDGEEATLSIQREVVYTSGYSEPNEPLDQPQPKQDSAKIGTLLTVKPILRNENIDLDIDYEVSNITGYEKHMYKEKYPYEIPVIQKVVTDTRALFPLGQTILLGGQKLTQREKKDGQIVDVNLLVLIKAEKVQIPENKER